MSETKRILDMLEQGKITSVEAMELMNALEEPVQLSSESQVSRKSNKTFKFLKVVIFVEEDEVNVNMSIPIDAIKVLGNIAQNAVKYIPEDAQSKIESKGINLTDIDIQGLLSALESGAEHNPELINIDMVDPEDGRVTVKIFFD